MDLINRAKNRKGLWPQRIEKTTVNGFDIMSLNVRVEIITTKAAAIKACEHIQMYRVLGFDTETRASFSKEKKYQLGLIQIATPGIIYLFRVNLMGIPDCLWDILESSIYTKVGMGLSGDIKQLRALKKTFVARGFIDLGTVAKAGGIVTFGLRNLVGIFLKQRLPKTHQISNWEAEELSEGQVTYAARDAWACLVLFYEISAQLFVD